ncbi:MAG: transcription elongation factor GreB [Gammaproteobacteria bacterium]|nr:transcription elongation factor GreB [Gammaproteobacteria bacterium]MCP4090764.1 transcription elongation factor GreB [Gammaproteobacteria bacterium]MCP4277191.1 transcription elongation factor GreB [Gammaproteobacteria bacterium]MCP4832813.1 transcription elongation factor GreB [Gammaproteobacteria bacterium]MCP4927999.1 transcription elongation factor GreB [Gammaproteobacteria bacterium]
MGRWKPPPPKSSPYITSTGFEALREELKMLWLRRRDVVKALSAAAAEGDRSENAEYIYRKKELGGIDYRIRYLQKRMPNLTVVTDNPTTERVFFGAWVSLEKEDGEEVEYRIVGPDETDTKTGFISMDSPLAKALLKKSLDDEVTLTLQGERTDYLITGIRYN